MNDRATSFERQRPRLQRLAYRMLGSRSDAEDAVQDTYVRWQQADVEPDNLEAWVTRVCVRVCLDRLKSLRRAREHYPGPWLPEPWVEADASIPVELDETLSLALLRLLERLSPAERAALVLHDVFGYEFEEVGEILARTAVSCRQLAVRARQHIRGSRPRFRVDPDEYETVARAFFEALRGGDVQGLRTLLSDDVVLRADGGGKAIAARKPVVGLHKVMVFLERTYLCLPSADRKRAVHCWFNGAPGLLAFDDDRPGTAMQLEIVDGRVTGIFALRNPDKLRAFASTRVDHRG